MSINKKKRTIHFLEDHPMSIPTKFGSNWSSSVREED